MYIPGVYTGAMTKRDWLIESRRTEGSPWVAQKSVGGFFLDSTRQGDEKHAIHLNEIIGWEKYRVVAA